jgi:hypothetical protein
VLGIVKAVHDARRHRALPHRADRRCRHGPRETRQ